MGLYAVNRNDNEMTEAPPATFREIGARASFDLQEWVAKNPDCLCQDDGENLDSQKLPITFLATGQFWVNNYAHILKTRRGSMRFYEQYIANMPIKDYLGGASRSKLTKGHMMKMRLPFPSIDQQEEAAGAFHKCDAKTSSAKQNKLRSNASSAPSFTN